MSSKWRIRLSGTGGQGIIKAALILAEAALIDGNNATQSQVYGPESRGGSTKAEVNISDSKILFPLVENPNLLLTMSEEAYYKYKGDLAGGGYLFIDGDIGVEDSLPAGINVCRLPITDLARAEIGNELTANVVALGAINAVTALVGDAAMEEALDRNFNAKVAALNKKAYYLGKEAAGRA